LVTLILFLAAFYAGIFFLSNIVYKTSLDNARAQAFAQHNFVANLLASNLAMILERERDMDKARDVAMDYYAKYYEKRGVRLELLPQKDVTVRGSLGGARVQEQLTPEFGRRQSLIVSQDGHMVIYVSGYMAGHFSDHILIYSQDITDIAQAQQALTNRLIFSGVIVTLLFLAVLYLLLNRLMKPVRVLQQTSEQIAAGAYDVRADIKGNDEIALLGLRFNSMADEILSRMDEERQNALAKQQFIDNLAHELRTPLTTIYGYAEFLQRAKASDDDRISATDHIMQQVQRMQALSAKLLELSITRRTEIDKEEIHLASCLERVYEMLLPSLGQEQVKLAISCGDQIVYGSEVLIEQLLINLLDNAVKAIPKGGRISLKVFGEDGVVIEIADQGRGMAPQQIERIFEPFYRVDAARSRALGGAGLGLSLCKQIADVHNARIDVVSRVGEGTTVTLCFTTP
ncbi:MAG: HAMP domain-containing histidine kinase, partial [Gracilibacteraceae bacterium]|nr:HAMP domain-containing histidine kinase [Gracilibacteraceae bacterium]